MSGWFVGVPVGGVFGGSTSPLSQAIETDISFDAQPLKTYTNLGLATETDIGLPAIANKSLTLGQASETNIGLALGALKTVHTGLPSETGIGFDLGIFKTVHVGFASETDAGFLINVNKTFVLGLALEIDAAQEAIVFEWGRRRSVQAIAR